MPAEDLFTCSTVLVCLDVPLVFCGGDQLMCSFEHWTRDLRITLPLLTLFPLVANQLPASVCQR